MDIVAEEEDVSNPDVFKRHMSKSTRPHPCFYNNDYSYLVDLSIEEKYTTSITKHYAARYYKEGMENIIPERWSKDVHRYQFEALNVRRSDDKEYELSYANLPRLSVNDVEDMYLLQVQDKLHHLLLEFVKHFNNALLMFIRRTVIKKKLSEVKKFCDGTLVKIQDNLIDMLTKNKLGSGNKRLKGRDWTDYDVKSSKEMLKKIDEILRHRERRLKEYVGGHPKNVNPHTFVRPMLMMDDPNITMEEYIKLQAKKAQRRGRTFNWQNATYGKIYCDDLDFFTYFEADYPAIVYDDALTSNENV
ncbi:hypothetical protein Tco_0260720 [Tanacetum coccineum]